MHRLTRLVGLLALTTLSVAIAESANAQPLRRSPEPPKIPETPGLWNKTAVGGQLGPWLASEFGDDATSEQGRFDGNETAFHLEFFYFPHLHSILNGDFNIGAISRGEFRITNPATNIISFGDATLYPIGLGLTLFPLARKTDWKFQPHVRAGGSLIILTERVDFRRTDGFLIDVDSKTHAEIGYYAGGGVSAVLGTKVLLIGSVKYQHAKFDEDVAGASDYSGIQILFGAAYLYR